MQWQLEFGDIPTMWASNLLYFSTHLCSTSSTHSYFTFLLFLLCLFTPPGLCLCLSLVLRALFILSKGFFSFNSLSDYLNQWFLILLELPGALFTNCWHPGSTSRDSVYLVRMEPSNCYNLKFSQVDLICSQDWKE